MRTACARVVAPNRAWLGTLIVCLGACGAPAPDVPHVAWEPDRRVAGAMAPGATMVLLDGGIPAMQAAWRPVGWPDDSLACAGSFVAARARGDTVFGVWRTDSAGVSQLRLARSGNGGIRWDEPVALGGAEQDALACLRPPAGVTVDSGRGAVHVVYFGSAARATGIMATRVARDLRTIAPPQLIADGPMPAAAAIAARGDTVAVVFETPTRPGGIVWLALVVDGSEISRWRTPLSAAGARASSPAVSLREGRLGAAWNEAGHAGRGPAAIARVGRITR